MGFLSMKPMEKADKKMMINVTKLKLKYANDSNKDKDKIAIFLIYKQDIILCMYL